MPIEEPLAPENQENIPKEIKKKHPMSMKQKRSLVKKGMISSMGTLLVTGLIGTHRKSISKHLHIVSGITLVGFSLWHHSLYAPKKAKSVENKRNKSEE